MRFDDEFDDLDDDIFSMYGIETYNEDADEDFEAIGSFIEEEEE